MITLQQHISEGILDADFDIELKQLKDFKYFEDHYSKPITHLYTRPSGLEHYRYQDSDIMYEFLDFYKKVVGRGGKKLKKYDACMRYFDKEDLCIVTVTKPRDPGKPSHIVQIIDCKNQNIMEIMILNKFVHLTIDRASNLIIPSSNIEVIAIPHVYYELMKDVLLKKIVK